MKKRKKQSKRVSGVPADAKMVAEATLTDGTKTTLYAGKDGAIYAVRLERVTYRILGGSV